MTQELVIIGDEAWTREEYDALEHGKAWTYASKGCRCADCLAAFQRHRRKRKEQKHANP